MLQLYVLQWCVEDRGWCISACNAFCWLSFQLSVGYLYVVVVLQIMLKYYNIKNEVTRTWLEGLCLSFVIVFSSSLLIERILLQISLLSCMYFSKFTITIQRFLPTFIIIVAAVYRAAICNGKTNLTYSTLRDK